VSDCSQFDYCNQPLVCSPSETGVLNVSVHPEGPSGYVTVDHPLALPDVSLPSSSAITPLSGGASATFALGCHDSATQISFTGSALLKIDCGTGSIRFSAHCEADAFPDMCSSPDVGKNVVGQLDNAFEDAGAQVQGACTNCAGTYVDTQRDKANCGECGRACAAADAPPIAGTCTGGRCVSSFQLFFDGVTAVDGTNLYWIGLTGPTVSKAPVAGGAVATVATDNAVSSHQGLAADGSTVFWTDFNLGTVKSAPAAGGPIATLASGQDHPATIAVNGTNVVWINRGTSNNGAVVEAPAAGGQATTLTSGLTSPWRLAVDDANAYWTDTTLGVVMKVPLTGGKPSTLASGQNNVGSVVVDKTSVYWANGGSIMKVPPAGGTPVPLVAGRSGIGPMALDGDTIYWAEKDSSLSRLVKMPVAGGAPTTLEFLYGENLQVDANNVYLDLTRVSPK
jgi:hypothetical protein